jgi:hypothetical protein
MNKKLKEIQEDIRKLRDADSLISHHHLHEYDKVIDKLENLLEKTPEFRMHPNQSCFDGEISELDWMDMNK